MTSSQYLKGYLKRIGFTGVIKSNLDTLKTLHRLHTQTFPFENINPLFHLPISLKPEDLYQKMIMQKRGGYCFEQNLLFLKILQEIGFEARGLTGRVIYRQPEEKVNPRTHLLILLDFNHKNYICDTGFGGQVLTAPLLLDTEKPQQTTLEDFRILSRPDYYLMQSKIQREWVNLYKFDLQHQYFVDYKLANWYTAAHPDSSFTKNLNLAIIKGKKRYNLSNYSLSIHAMGHPSQQKKVHDPDELKEIIKHIFNLDLPQTKNTDSILSTLPGSFG